MGKPLKRLKRLLDRARALFRGKGGGKEEDLFPRLRWCFGGVDGSKAAEDTGRSGYRIESARLGGDGKKVVFSGSGDMWGCRHGNPDARCCIFFFENGTWYGGFWEWGSDDRTSRAFDNIDGRLRGWVPARFYAAREYAFLIMDKACRRRSNVVTFGRDAK